MKDVLFVGSVGLDSSEDVFNVVGKHCGHALKRIPDGEPAGRRFYVSWQVSVLRTCPQLTPVGDPMMEPVPMKIAPGVKPQDIHFGELGYARDARVSYQDFLEARKAGNVPAKVRFQVCLPPAWAVIKSFVIGPDVDAVFRAYEKAMFKEITTMLRYIPAQDLAIQWDCAVEMMCFDGQWDMAPSFPGMHELFAGNFARMSAAVPVGVELGYHLCYGDFEGVHFITPKDTAKMVELANMVAANTKRQLNWLHMPVPIERTDEAFYKPLAGLKLDPATELYLGLIHAKDGVEGTKKRMDAASKYVKKFGVASECGIARARNIEATMEFIKAYNAAAAL